VQAIFDRSAWQNDLGLEGPAQRGHNINPLRNIQVTPAPPPPRLTDMFSSSFL